MKLEENYRSTTPILHTAKQPHQKQRGPTTEVPCWSRNQGNDLVRLIATEDEKEEADMIAKEVESAHFASKQPLEDFAVLFRTNDQSRVPGAGLSPAQNRLPRGWRAQLL